MKLRITCVLVDRANYARLRPVLLELNQNPSVDLKVVCAGTMVLERFGSAVKDLVRDGIPVHSSLYFEVEGSTPLTMTKSLGAGVSEFASEFSRSPADIVLLIGDRYEAFAAAIAASYMNLCVAHVQGGEVSGSIDESARHAISKLSHFHFPATQRSAEFLIRMGESKNTVFMLGCPSGDQIVGKELQVSKDEINRTGVGCKIDPAEPYQVVLFHPVTTDYGGALHQVETLFTAIQQSKFKTIWMWPNIDAGSDQISKFLRTQREGGGCDSWARFIKHYDAFTFLKVMNRATCLIGNSSSFVRDSSFLGTPVVLVGNRQFGRECAENVVRVPVDQKQILDAIKKQREGGRYSASHLYGDGQAGKKIANTVANLKPYTQKSISYLQEDRV